MISDAELERNGWERERIDGQSIFRMRVPSRLLTRWRAERGTVFQRSNSGLWVARGRLHDEADGEECGTLLRTFRTARAAMAWLQGEPWRRG